MLIYLGLQKIRRPGASSALSNIELHLITDISSILSVDKLQGACKAFETAHINEVWSK
jgi:hypothetical protein